MKQLIFNIQRLCLNDGPGIRTVVFIKGCPLKCKWCHNPESQNIKKELIFNNKKCIDCNRCFDVCNNHYLENNIHKINREKCTLCGKCIDVCNGALEFIGFEKNIDMIINELMKDIDFYNNSNGGITISGGEPFINPIFLKDLLYKAKKNNLHICLETSGYTAWDNIESIMDYVDLFLWDLKETDDILHKKYTGVSNDLIINNLYKLNKKQKKIILRCIIIPSINDRDDHLKRIAEIANDLENVIEINIEPYNSLGEFKYETLGKKYELNIPKYNEQELINKCQEIINKYTTKKVKKA